MSPTTRNPYRWRNFGTRQPARNVPREARVVALLGLRDRVPFPAMRSDIQPLTAVEVEDEIAVLKVLGYLRERFCE